MHPTMDRTDSARRLTDAELEAAGALARRVAANVAQAAEVRPDVIAHLIVTVLAEGHALIEDLPGVGKTTLARALARSLDLEVARIQCTADLLPADVVGTNVFNQRESRFEFRPGPIFANVVLVDEINRASPKTQSGLLECMQERRVTVDVHTHELARPFSSSRRRTRSSTRARIRCPRRRSTASWCASRSAIPTPRARPTCSPPTSRATASRNSSPSPTPPTCSPRRTPRRACAPPSRCGATSSRCSPIPARTRASSSAHPRAGLLLLRAPGAALLAGRDHALPDDVQQMSRSVLAHRIVLAPDAYETSGEHVVADAVAATPALVAMGRALGTGLLALVFGLTAALVDAEPLWVPPRRSPSSPPAARPGSGSAHAGCGCGARWRAPRHGGRAGPIVIEVRAGRLGLPPSRDRRPAHAAPVAAARRRARRAVRIEARFGRRGRRVLALPRVLIADPLGLATREVSARPVAAATTSSSSCRASSRSSRRPAAATRRGSRAAAGPPSAPRSSSTASGRCATARRPRGSSGPRSRAAPSRRSASSPRRARAARSSSSTRAAPRATRRSTPRSARPPRWRARSRSAGGC